MTATARLDLAFAGPEALAALVRAREVRPREVRPRELVELFLGRIEAIDPHCNAFRTTMPEQALAEAEAAAGSHGPLAGVPIAVKDELALAGQRATRGTRGEWEPAATDAER